MADILYTSLAIIILYKILDQLLRIPKITSEPTGKYKNILVTGCDTGFGNVFAKRMASKGYTVFAGCLLEKSVQELAKQNPACLKPFVMDVSKENSVKQGYQYVCSQLGDREGLWALINNAGIMGTNAPSEWLKKSHFEQVMDVNVYGILQVTTTFLPLIKKTKGRIVNTCSIVGRYTLPISGPYVTSKHAAEALSDTIRLEMMPFGVTVHILEPGLFVTNLVDPQNIANSIEKCFQSLDPTLQKEYGQDYLKGVKTMAAKVLPRTGSKNVNLVVDCYEHAVTARFPRYRYMPGYDSKFFYWWMSYTPEWFSDRVLSLTSKVAIPDPAVLKQGAKL